MSPSAVQQNTAMPTRRTVVHAGLFDDNNRLLLCRTHALNKTWQPFGGGVDETDAGLLVALARELQEELSIIVSVDRFTLVHQAPYDYGEGTLYFYSCILTPHEITTITPDTNEIAEMRWFDISELATLACNPGARGYFDKLLYTETKEGA